MATKLPSNNTSGHVGIQKGWNDRYVVQISTGDKVISLGTYDTIEEAVLARHTGEAKYRKIKPPLVKKPSKLKNYPSKITSILPQELFNEYLRYDKNEGKLYWTKKSASKIVQDPKGNWPEAGYVNSMGYHKFQLKGRVYSTARLIFFLENGHYPETVDHYDQNKLNNHISNLIGTTYAGNAKNLKLSKANRSGCTGVKNNYKDSFTAEIDYDGNHEYLGTFQSYEEAVKARKAAEKLFGFSPNHGQERGVK